MFFKVIKVWVTDPEGVCGRGGGEADEDEMWQLGAALIVEAMGCGSVPLGVLFWIIFGSKLCANSCELLDLQLVFFVSSGCILAIFLFCIQVVSRLLDDTSALMSF